MKTTTITASLFRIFDESKDQFSTKIRTDRYRALNFKCECPFSDDASILEWIFEATNSPHDNFDSEQIFILKCFYESKECAVSVGDVIQLDDRYYICCPVGWQLIENFQTTYDRD